MPELIFICLTNLPDWVWIGFPGRPSRSRLRALTVLAAFRVRRRLHSLPDDQGGPLARGGSSAIISLELIDLAKETVPEAELYRAQRCEREEWQ